MPDILVLALVRGSPRTRANQKKWGIFKCPFWGILLCHRQAHITAAADHRQQRGRASGQQTRGGARLVAGTDAGAQTTHAGNGRAGQ